MLLHSDNPSSRLTRAALSSESGSVLLIVLVATLAIASIGISSSVVTNTEMEVSANYRGMWRAYYAADGIAQVALGELVNTSRTLSRFPSNQELSTVQPQTIGAVELNAFALHSTGPQVQEPLQTGFYQGLMAMSQPFRTGVTVTTSDFPPAEATVSMGVQFDIIPIFQFAVFYDKDLELLPGPVMTLGGRVHTNKNLYVASGNSLTIDANVTSAGDIFNRRKDQNSSPGGAVRIRDSEGGFPAMSGLDSEHPDWRNEALARWDGNVRSRVHGVTGLNLTVADPENPHMIIEPGYDDDSADDRTSKLYYHAGMSINILNGQGFDLQGNRVDLGAAVAFTVIDDPREKHEMLTVELDVAELYDLAIFPEGPAVVYVGSFEPGNGIPEWEVTEGGGGPLGKMQEIIEGGAPELVDALEDILAVVEDAVGLCNRTPPDLQGAAGKISDAIADLWVMVDDGLLDAAEATNLQEQFEPIADCDLSGLEEEHVVAEWPIAWDSLTPPFAGGDTEFAVKLHNGSELEDALTIVTANPLYIEGNYNTVNKKPASVLADAITILSNAWAPGGDDLSYSRKNLNNRRASDTTINAAFALGNSETTTGNYNGGVENLPRFIEKWSGKRFTYLGSLIDLWYAEYAVGNWKYGDPVYKAPIRDWAFDLDFLDPTKLPPGTPNVYTLKMLQWSRS